MKVLIVCSGTKGILSPFIKEQMDALIKYGIEVFLFQITQKGLLGYLSHFFSLNKTISKHNPDIIHAHYGLSGLLANLQRSVPVITTYHGSDINNDKVFRISRLAIMLSKHNIFVSQKNIDKAKVRKRYSLIPCGVDTSLFYPREKMACREKMNLMVDKNYVLFSGSFDNEVKNPSLAHAAVAEIENLELIELKGYTREQVACLMNAVDVCLMTSHSEGSPQFIKEAMACNCPIVSVDVGDVKEIIGQTKGCVVVNINQAKLIKEKIVYLLSLNDRTNGNERIESLAISLDEVAQKIKELYTVVK
jgi:glycosyltransferase involved in cell wall biosynthesis